MDEYIFINGSTIKSLDEKKGEIGQYSIVYGSEKEKDFHGNFFTKNTNTGFFIDGVKYDVGLLNHRVPLFKSGQFDSETEKALKKISDITFKNPVVTTIDEVGEFSRLVLDLSDKYEKMVYELAKQGAFKWSSGAAPQTYKALDSGELIMFVTAERSLTPIPAEYRMLQHRVMPLKTYTDFLSGNSIRSDKDMNTFLKGYSPLNSFLKHYGPGDHKNGTSQEVHGNGGGSSKKLARKRTPQYTKKELKEMLPEEASFYRPVQRLFPDFSREEIDDVIEIASDTYTTDPQSMSIYLEKIKNKLTAVEGGEATFENVMRELKG